MVKSTPRERRLQLLEQVNSLSLQFGKTVGLGGDEEQGQSTDQGEVMNWSSKDADHGKLGQGSASSELQLGALISPPRSTSFGFEVDLSGSQLSDTPFLRPIVRTLSASAPEAGQQIVGIRDNFDGLVYQVNRLWEFWYKRRSSRLGVVVKQNKPKISDDRLVLAERIGLKLSTCAYKKLRKDLSELVPGSIEEIKSLDPSGNGKLVWSIIESWLEQRPHVAAQLNLTKSALKLMTNYAGRATPVVRPANNSKMMMVYAVAACQLDPETYKELCSFLFPEEERFLRESSPSGKDDNKFTQAVHRLLG